MKNLLLLSFLFFSFQAGAQTLFTYGKYKVTTTEFLEAFNKNKVYEDTNKNALEDYLDLYIQFKLKTQEAKDLKFDTLPALKAELQSFRNHIEKNFLHDKGEFDFLNEQAIERAKKDIHLKVIFIEPSIKTDTAGLYAASLKVWEAVQNNPSAGLSELNQKNIQVTEEDAGFITAFTLPYELENIAYGLQPGKSSAPLASDEGYQVFVNASERPAAGKIKIAQILIATSPNSNDSWNEAAQMADSLYKEIQAGADFGRLAEIFSFDRNTYFNDGEMPEFGVGKFSPDFESQAFGLSYDGEVSRPFKTSYGYHILKRISAAPVSEIPESDFKYEISQKLLQDSRLDIARNKLVKDATAKTGFLVNKFSEPDLYIVTDSALTENKDITSGEVSQKTALISFNDDERVTAADWQQYLRFSGRTYNADLHSLYKELWPEFVNYSILENYRKRLTDFNKEFAQQINEFQEGNMLFELWQQKIWNVAAEDSIGLHQFYDTHKEQYKWDTSADVIIFTCNNEESARFCINELKNGTPWRTIMERNSLAIQADSGRFELSQLQLDVSSVKDGLTAPVVNKFDETAFFYQVLKTYPENMQRSFEDSRGLVVDGYQKVLEEEWISQLKKKYPVKIKKKELDSLLASGGR